MVRRLERRFCEAASPSPDLVITVPISRKKLLRRGFDHVNELGKFLAPSVGVEIRSDLISLTREPDEQIGQDASTRRRNLRGVFAMHADLSGQTVAILDDVMTTGATFEALAKTVKRAGAARVDAWALARTP